MAITITSLGTVSDKASAANLDFTYANGLVGNAGDWIIVSVAGDTALSSCIFCCIKLC